MKSLTVFTHARPTQTNAALRRLIALAREAGSEVHLPEDEARKHNIDPQEGVVVDANPNGDTDPGVSPRWVLSRSGDPKLRRSSPTIFTSCRRSACFEISRITR